MTDVIATSAASSGRRSPSGRKSSKPGLGGFLDAGGHPSDETKKQKDTKRVVDACNGDAAIDQLLTAAKEDRLGPSTSAAPKKRSKGRTFKNNVDPLASRSDHGVSLKSKLAQELLGGDEEEQQPGRSPGAKARRKIPHRSKSSVEKISSGNNSNGQGSGEAPRKRMPPSRCKSMDENTAPQRIPRSMARGGVRIGSKEGGSQRASRTSGRTASEGSLTASRTTSDSEGLQRPLSSGEKKPRKPKKKEGENAKEKIATPDSKADGSLPRHQSADSPTSVVENEQRQQQQQKPKVLLEYGKAAVEDEEDETDFDDQNETDNAGIMQFDPTADNHCLLVDRDSDHFPSQKITLDIDYGYDFDSDNNDEDDEGQAEGEGDDRRGRFFTSNRIFGIRSFNAKFKSNKAAGCESSKPEEAPATSEEQPEKRGLFGFARQSSGKWGKGNSGPGDGGGAHAQMLDDSAVDLLNDS